MPEKKSILTDFPSFWIDGSRAREPRRGLAALRRGFAVLLPLVSFARAHEGESQLSHANCEGARPSRPFL